MAQTAAAGPPRATWLLRAHFAVVAACLVVYVADVGAAVSAMAFVATGLSTAAAMVVGPRLHRPPDAITWRRLLVVCVLFAIGPAVRPAGQRPARPRAGAAGRLPAARLRHRPADPAPAAAAARKPRPGRRARRRGGHGGRRPAVDQLHRRAGPAALHAARLDGGARRGLPGARRRPAGAAGPARVHRARADAVPHARGWRDAGAARRRRRLQPAGQPWGAHGACRSSTRRTWWPSVCSARPRCTRRCAPSGPASTSACRRGRGSGSPSSCPPCWCRRC